MTRRPLFVLVALVAGLLIAAATSTVSAREGDSASERGERSALPDDFQPAVVRAQQDLGRYFVVMSEPSVAQRIRASDGLSPTAQEAAAQAARQSQAGAIDLAEALGGELVFRFDTLVNGFSAALSSSAAADLAARDDVKSVQPVSIVQKLMESSAPFIGADQVHEELDASGEGMTVAVVDTGIDYTHANYGGPGTVEAFESNDPNFVEPGTFPTDKVVGGFDLVGSNYDLLDEDPGNDFPQPDGDPIDDDDGHGSHTSGTVAGIGVPGEIGPGVAPEAKLIAIKVWDEGNSSDDVLVAGYERAMDPNDDGDTSDAPDVLSFSGGVDYGTENSVEARAAQRVVNMGTVFVAAAGNSGNQPVGFSAYITGTPANAPGVISVAASIDEFNAQALTIDDPPTELPDGGLMVNQEWSPALDSDITSEIVDAREFDPPADPENPSGPDQLLCDPIAGTPFAGKIALVFKASSTTGDCFADDKVVNAQNAGAIAVVLWNGFGGLPSQIGIGGDGSNITVPVLMISTLDSETLGATVSPDAGSGSFNTVPTTVTLHSTETLFPQFTDALTDFTSEGPARGTNALKPDISAPGFDIQSTANGTGDEGVKLSGTSMAAPHVSGVATLLRQLHPDWSPGRIKAVLMNQTTQEVNDNTLGSPVSATVMGSGRVQAFESATAVSVAEPGSLSYGLNFASGATTEVRKFTVTNTEKKAKKKGKGKKARKKARKKNKKRTHDYVVSGGGPRYAAAPGVDLDPSVASVDVSAGGGFADDASFTLKPGQSRQVSVRLNLDPSAIGEAEQELGWYYLHANVDGNVTIEQTKHGNDSLHVPWHVAPLATSDNSLSESELDLSGGPASMELVDGPAAGASYADLYLLGAVDSDNSKGEEDVVATGARSFTGNDVEDGQDSGVPSGTDVFGEIGWLDFLADPDAPVDPVEFGVQTYGVHNVTETLEVDVLVDTGADGVYAGDDEDIPADYLLVKLAAPGGEVCVFDLSLPDALDECAATYFADYSNYNSNLVGLVVGAQDIGLSNADSTFAYQVVACTGVFSGDAPGLNCDEAGGVDDNGIYTSQLNAADPALAIDPLVCKGFWDGGACDAGDPIQVDVGSAAPGDDPSILALFPNNAPSHDPTVVTTDTGEAP